MDSQDGTSPIDLVLLPGLDGTGRLFAPFVRKLPASIVPHVIPYPAGERLGYDDLVEYVTARLPTGRRLLILGESFAGPLAMRIAARKPPGLAGLILCGTFVRNPHPWIPRWAGAFVFPWQFRMWPLIWWGRKVLGWGVSGEVQQAMAEAQAAAGGTALAHRLREVVRVDASQDLARVDVPILILEATRDWIVPIWNGRRIARAAERRETPAGGPPRQIPFDTGHLILQSRPGRAVEAIEEFVRTLG